MMQKRLRKLVGLKKEIIAPPVYGPQKAKKMLVGWGSTCGAIREAVDILQRQKVSVNAVNLNELWPFPAEAMASLIDSAQQVYVIESNATGQLAHLIRAETGKKTNSILKYDGRPFTPADIVRELGKEMSA